MATTSVLVCALRIWSTRRIISSMDFLWADLRAAVLSMWLTMSAAVWHALDLEEKALLGLPYARGEDCRTYENAQPCTTLSDSSVETDAQALLRCIRSLDVQDSTEHCKHVLERPNDHDTVECWFPTHELYVPLLINMLCSEF